MPRIGNPRRLQLRRKLQRRLPAKLDDHAQQLALLRLALDDLEHVLGRQRLEIEAVRRVRVGRHRLRVAIDHDRLEPRPVAAERERGVAAAIIELDPLPDPVGPAAEDDDLASGR